MKIGDRVEWCGSQQARRWRGTILKVDSNMVRVKWESVVGGFTGEHLPKFIQPLNVLDKIVEAIEA